MFSARDKERFSSKRVGHREINGHGYSVSWCDIYRNGVLAGTMLNQFHTGTTSITSVANGSCDATTTTTAAPTTTTTAGPTTTTTPSPGCNIAKVQSKTFTDAGTASKTCTYDATTTTGNLLVMVVRAKNGNFQGPPVITPPAGWTERKTTTASGNYNGTYIRTSIYTQENSAAESSSTWGYSGL